MGRPFDPVKDMNKISGPNLFYGNQTHKQRGTRFKIESKGITSDSPRHSQQSFRHVAVDGELWAYERFVTFQTIDNAVEFIFDADRYFEGFKSFGDTKNHPNRME